MENLEVLCRNHMIEVCNANPDPSHDILHVERVVSLAKKLAKEENANLDIVVPAAYLHDCFYISKTDPRRSQASKLSADKALELLSSWGLSSSLSPGISPDLLPEIHHAVLAHSFSANVKAKTLEAKVVQDADRLDAMGAIGIMRCLGFSGLSLRPFYNQDDPFCEKRTANDSTNALDHFFVKLLNLQERLNTPAAQAEGAVRLATMKIFIESLKLELLV